MNLLACLTVEIALGYIQETLSYSENDRDQDPLLMFKASYSNAGLSTITPDFAKIAKSLENVTKKESGVVDWDERCDVASEVMQTENTRAPIFSVHE